MHVHGLHIDRQNSNDVVLESFGDHTDRQSQNAGFGGSRTINDLK